MTGQTGEGVRGTLRVLQEDVFRYLQLERPRRDSVPGEPRRDRARESGRVDVTRGDVDRDRHVQALGAPVRHLPERRLQHVLRQMRHQPRRLGDRYELVRRHLPALRVHPADQRLEAGDLSVEADLRLVVQFDLVRVEGAAQIAQQTQAVRGVGVPLGLVDLHARTVPLRLVHRDVGPPEQPLGVEGVVGEDGDAGAGFQDQGEAVEVERGAEGRDETTGDPGRGRRGVGDRQ